jgi:hypothetical protein
MISSFKTKIYSGLLPNTHLGRPYLKLVYAIFLHEPKEKIHNVDPTILIVFIRVYLRKKD